MTKSNRNNWYAQKTVKTKEKWHPMQMEPSEGNPRLMTVSIALIPFGGENLTLKGYWRICVWGSNKHGMSKDFGFSERATAVTLFYRLGDFTSRVIMQNLLHMKPVFITEDSE